VSFPSTDLVSPAFSRPITPTAGFSFPPVG
jgi:hypothetical protein